MIGTTLSHYRIVSELGRGGMGVVYRAKDTDLERDVALKVMSSLELASEDARARFRREAQAAAQLSHPNVATIYQIGEDDGKLFIAMELVDGQTLEDVIASAVSTESALRLGAQLAEGIAAAHARGIVHRDIKPANVMVDQAGRVKILDFGLAKTDSSPNLTVQGSTVGTIAYMSPEQVRGEEVGPPSDMWSFGVLLHELLSGDRPFSAAYDAALSFQILNESAPELPATVPDGVRKGVQSLLAKDADERSKDARDFLAEYAPSGSYTSAARPAEVATARRAWMVPILAGVAAVIALVGFWWLWPSGPVESHEQDGIAVFPFIVIGGDETDTFGDGFARLLTDRLDESGAVRTVEYNGLMSHVDEAGGRVGSPEEAMVLAEQFHAEGYVFGDVVKVPGSIVVSASMYSAMGEEEASAEVAIAEESELLHAVNDLGRQLLASRYGESGNVSNQAGALSTESYPALKLYLQGMDHQRAGEFIEAYARFDEATEIDSTFAMAWYGKGRMSGWAGNPPDPEGKMFAIALSYPDKLPKRFRERIAATQAMRLGHQEEAVELFEHMTRTYPDDADAWALRGDLHYHAGRWLGRPISEATQFMQRAQQLDPGNVEMSGHLAITLVDDHPKDHLVEFLDRFVRGWRELDDFVYIQNWIDDDFSVDSRWMDSLAVGNLWGLPLTHGLYFAEAPWRVEAYLDRLDSERQSQIEPRMSPRTLVNITTGRMDAALRSSVDAGPSAELAVLQWFTLLPALLRPAEDILDSVWQSAVVPLMDTIAAEDEAGRLSFWYHAAALAEIRNDEAGAAEIRQNIQADTSDTARGLEFLLDARRHLNRGEYMEAEAAADSGFDLFSHEIVRLVPGSIWPFQARMLKLEALFGLGRQDEVLLWVNVLGDGGLSTEDGAEGVYFLSWWAAQAYMKGKAHLDLGNIDEAEAAFTRFIELYEKADPHYQPLVNDARADLERIAGIRAREPVS